RAAPGRGHLRYRGGVDAGARHARGRAARISAARGRRCGGAFRRLRRLGRPVPYALGGLPGRWRDRGRSALRLPHPRSRHGGEGKGGHARRLGSRHHRARRARALHAQGNHGAARESAEHAARAAARRGRHGAARRPEHQRRAAASGESHRVHRLRNLAALALLTLKMGRLRSLSILQGREVVRGLGRLPELVERVLAKAPEVERIAERMMRASNVLYLGRGYNFPVALEGALKLKEISYIHAEGYPAAEMKHGPIALIDDLMPVVFLAPKDAVYQKVVSNVEEVKARGGRVIAVVTEGDSGLAKLADQKIEVPETLDLLTPVLTVL